MRDQEYSAVCRVCERVALSLSCMSLKAEAMRHTFCMSICAVLFAFSTRWLGYDTQCGARLHVFGFTHDLHALGILIVRVVC